MCPYMVVSWRGPRKGVTKGYNVGKKPGDQLGVLHQSVLCCKVNGTRQGEERMLELAAT